MTEKIERRMTVDGAYLNVRPEDVERLFRTKGEELHRKIDETRDAYCGFIFPVTRPDLLALTSAFDIDPKVAGAIYREGQRFSTFAPEGRGPSQITNHIVGATLLALRNRDLGNGLESVTDASILELARAREAEILEVAAARSGWFGRIYFPCQAFSNALGVFGAKVSPETVYTLGKEYGYAAQAGQRRTLRGDFGIALWLAALAFAP